MGVIRRSTMLLSHGLSCRLRSRGRMPVEEGYCGARVGKQRHLETARYHPHAEPKESQTPPIHGGYTCPPWGLTPTADTGNKTLPMQPPAGLERSLLPLSPGERALNYDYREDTAKVGGVPSCQLLCPIVGLCSSCPQSAGLGRHRPQPPPSTPHGIWDSDGPCAPLTEKRPSFCVSHARDRLLRGLAAPGHPALSPQLLGYF